jgi:pyruvate formate lyase activating enzyme
VSDQAEAACRVFDVQRFSVHDGPGIRTTVFLAGCPLRCAWCHNPEGFSPRGGAPMSPAAIVQEVLRDRAFYDVSGGGLTISGGEPLLSIAPVRALLKEAKRHGLHTCVQTSGAVPEEHVSAVLGLVDLFQLDLKHMDPARHRALTGVDPARVHQTARLLAERGAHLELRMPLIPGINDDEDNLTRVATFVVSLGLRALTLVPYHRLYLDKYARLGLEPSLRAIEPPSVHDVARVRAVLARGGVAGSEDAASASTLGPRAGLGAVCADAC